MLDEGLFAPPIMDDGMASDSTHALIDFYQSLEKDQWMVVRVPNEKLKDADEEINNFCLQIFQNFPDDLIIYHQESAILLLSDKVRVYVKMNNLDVEFNFYANLTRMLCKDIEIALKTARKKNL